MAERRPAVGGGDREIHEVRAEPRRGVTRRDRRKRQQGVILHRRDRPPDSGRRAAVHRGPARWRLSQRGAVTVGPERHDPGGSSGAEGMGRQARRRGRPRRADEVASGRGLRQDPLSVPDGHGRGGCVEVWKSRRRAVRQRRDAEREPFEPPPLARQGGVTIGGGSLIGPSARERGGNDGESQQRRHEQRTPGHDQQPRSLAQAPHEGHDRGRDAYARDHRRGGETYVERATRESPVQSRDGLGRVEQGAPREREREQREQYAEVRAGVCVGIGQPTTEAQRADPHIQQRDHDAGGAHRYQRELSQPFSPRQLSQVVAEVLVEDGVRDTEGRRA